jgi:hypothetical protein
VYSACIFCQTALGTNEDVPHFPIGGRLAFDSAKGRLWVVCQRCGQWNLAPLEERWEAIEECERAYRSVRTRVSTTEIGLARLADGLDLVRIGAPLRPEFAAWRFGDQLGARRRRVLRLGAVGAGTVAGVGGTIVAAAVAPVVVSIVAPVLFMGSIIAFGVAADQVSKKTYPGPLRLTADDGSRVELGSHEVRDVQMRPDDTPDGFRLGMDVVEDNRSLLGRDPLLKHVAFSGKEARRAARLLLPRINGFGATQRSIQSAVDAIDDVGSTERFIPHALSIARKAGLSYSPIHAYPTPVRLAIEMVLHEEAERRAMDGELAELETAWREAERIAGIADDLLLPSHVNEFLAKHRNR